MEDVCSEGESIYLTDKNDCGWRLLINHFILNLPSKKTGL